MEVVLNGERREVPGGSTLADLVALTGSDPEAGGLAVALDGEVVPRSAWGKTGVPEGARVEVVTAIQGGSAEWELGGRSWTSRLLVGTGGFRSLGAMEEALEASGTEIATVAFKVDPPTRLEFAPRDIREGDVLVAHLGIWSRQDAWAPAVLEPLLVGLKARGLCFATLHEHPQLGAAPRTPR